MNKTFITFLVVIISFGVGVVLMTWKEPTDGLDMDIRIVSREN